MFNMAYAGAVPLQGTELAGRWDNLYGFLFYLSVFFFVLVVGAMLYFAVVYRHKKHPKTVYITGNHFLEAVWIAIPTLLLLIIFGWGYSVYHAITQAPSDAYEIRVIGKQWLWNFQYDNGKTTTGEVYVPINRPVKFIMISEDVLHGFFIPAFRVKQDVVPGMYSSLWFTATVPGKHQAYCTEYCGTSHSGMLAKVIVLTDDQWKAWENDKPIGDIPDARLGDDPEDLIQQASSTAQTSQNKPVPNRANSAVGAVKNQMTPVQQIKQPMLVPLVAQGKAIYENKGCVACHSRDGSNGVGPTHKGLFGSKVTLTDGSVITADEKYLMEHIWYPQNKTVKGYNPVMPTFKGSISATEMNALIAYMKTLK